jgi:hypothetical protein
MKLIASALILLAIGMTAYAADVDGSWGGSIQTPQGEFPVSFTFKADGAKLTGSMLGLDGMPVPIKDGKIDGNTITFNVTLDFGGMPFDLSYKGVVAAAEIKMTAEALGMPFEFVVKKDK